MMNDMRGGFYKCIEDSGAMTHTYHSVKDCKADNDEWPAKTTSKYDLFAESYMYHPFFPRSVFPMSLNDVVRWLSNCCSPLTHHDWTQMIYVRVGVGCFIFRCW